MFIAYKKTNTEQLLREKKLQNIVISGALVINWVSL